MPNETPSQEPITTSKDSERKEFEQIEIVMEETRRSFERIAQLMKSAEGMFEFIKQAQITDPDSEVLKFCKEILYGSIEGIGCYMKQQREFAYESSDLAGVKRTLKRAIHIEASFIEFDKREEEARQELKKGPSLKAQNVLNNVNSWKSLLQEYHDDLEKMNIRTIEDLEKFFPGITNPSK